MNVLTSRTLTITAVAAVAAAAPAGTAGASVEESEEQHCVVQVVGQEKSGRYLTDEPTCYPTLAEALSGAGALVPEVARSGALTSDQVEVAVASASSNLGIHFDGANRTGSSITVAGTTCGGGYVNLSTAWINRISSTINSCAVVNFWNGYDKTGNYEQTGFTTENLGALNNAANSIGYAS